MKNALLQIVTDLNLREKLIVLGIWIIAFFAPTAVFLLIVGFFIVCDMITGIIAANARKERIHSRKLSRTVSKFIAYSVGILVAHVVNKMFFPEFPAMQLMSGFIAFIEIKSIDENIKDITGYSLFKGILDKLKSKE